MPTTVAIVQVGASNSDAIVRAIDHSDEVECVAICPSAEYALTTLPNIRPDVVLVDTPCADSPDCLQQLKQRLPNTEFIVLAANDDYECIRRSIQAGANGYVLKRDAGPELLKVIRDVRAGGSVLPGIAVRKFISSLRDRAHSTEELEKLSLRELQVLRMLKQGSSYKQSASQLGVSYDTIRTHVNHIYRKLGVHSRAQAVKQVERKQDDGRQ